MPETTLVCVIASKLGPLCCASGPDGVIAVDLPPNADVDAMLAWLAQRPGAQAPVVVAPEQCPAGQQLLAYLAGQRDALTMPADLRGVGPFSRRVLEAIRHIPPGQTKTYGQVAAELGSPKAARAVGQALHRNPAALFCPCHRVVGAGGGLVGFASGLTVKRALLDFEAGGPPLI